MADSSSPAPQQTPIGSEPLAQRYRPTTFDEVVGQRRPKTLIKTMLASGRLTSMIFYGPSGCGKTTMAHLIASSIAIKMHWLNATTDTVKDLRAITDAADGPVLVYLDEIQYWNKKQQQSLLSFVEDGSVVLIAATTENPWHGIYDALLSRLSVIEFERVSKDDIAERLRVVLNDLGETRIPDATMDAIAGAAAGDVRRALTLTEMVRDAYPNTQTITVNDVHELVPSMNMSGFDTLGDNHYQLVSALQKSIRGSDPDAAVFYLCRFLEAGDMVSPCRRLPVICCEDIGLADPNAIVHTIACIEAAERLGFPECYKPLTEAVIYLATAPKSASNEPAWMAAKKDIEDGRGVTVPDHISAEHHPRYVWPQDHPYHWTPQQYLPDDLVGTRYYTPGDNDFEQARYAWWYYVQHDPSKLGRTQQPRM